MLLLDSILYYTDVSYIMSTPWDDETVLSRKMLENKDATSTFNSASSSSKTLSHESLSSNILDLV